MKDTFLFVGPIIAGLVGSYLTYYFTMKSKQQESILKFKEEKYSNLLILLQGFIGNTVSTETKRKFFEEQYKSWLYCSDEVVKAINNMVRLVIESHGENQNHEAGRKAVGEIVLAMRKDLLGKTNLNYDAFIYTSVIK
ncbi:MAG: hypothetical protein A2X54_02480 [Nitrospirae bacterium GWF2_44_13]|nr:MAG: hypothetical protein A2X54_02480 [Nitrospirae bacterium GWF2_44_13]OGW36006.1 MAG: hypothetical protein A2088_00230 [Nitrospirae bacterium GWD2_44_7]OGW64604.1 MAG: hypothetical protein A2222_04000 [Nitrospirae bacterium RIFOXYA2_FULL_44_9]OGW73045.1 MAG: hypothetical protein A2484_02040 [Nitrospirae bacterium RIFOXYC2_FULL_44_7]HBG93180.1 hypothetical protein [Nitrospiraceae bacterium]